jgi:Putative lumazine-binding
MKTSITALFSALAAALLICATPSAQAQGSNDREAVQAVMQTLVRAFEKSDLDLLRKATRTDGLMIWHARRANLVQTEKFSDWYKKWDGKTADDEAQRKRTFEVLDVTEETALVKLMLDYPTAIGTDYLMLVKAEGEWKIMTKNSKWKAKATSAK